MAHVFLDESGDLGFKPKSSKFFIFTVVLTNNHRKIEKIIKKARKDLKNKFKIVNELHAYHSQPALKNRILKLVSKNKEIKICA